VAVIGIKRANMPWCDCDRS